MAELHKPHPAQLRKRLKRRRVEKTVRVTELLCPICERWFEPGDQPPRHNTQTCSNGSCRVTRWRILKRADENPA